YGGQSGQATLTVGPATLVAIDVAPASLSLAKGLTHTYTATARWSDATSTDVTATATWTTDDASVATALGEVITAVQVGSTQVHAIAQDVTGSGHLDVTSAAVAAVTLSPANATLAAGTTTQYTATAVYTDGSKTDVTTPAVWASTPETIATVSTTGLARGVAPGSAVVSAVYSGTSAQTSLTVTNAVLASISISPSTSTVPVAASQAFTATGIFSDGTREDLTTQVTWSSSNTGVASISNATGTQGIAIGVSSSGQGITVTIGAVFAGITGTASLTVTTATLTSITVDPPSASIAAGTATAFTATALYSDLSTADVTEFATWVSSTTTVATVSNDPGTRGVATGVGAGTTTVTASFGGQTDNSTLTVTAAYLVGITVTPPNPTIPVGVAQQLTATGTFSDGSTQDVTSSVGWTSSSTAIADVSNAQGQAGLVTAITAGTATVTATQAGVSASTLVTVSTASIVSIDVTPATTTLPQGYSRPYAATAHYSDATTRDVTTLATWTSSNTATATISNATGSHGLATGVAASITQVTISATLSSISGTALLTVTNASLSSIAVTPSPFSVAVQKTIQLRATGTFSDGLKLDITGQCNWSTLKRAIATVSRTGLVQGVGVGSTTIKARKGNTSGTATANVTAY
ncbi:MAG TPA: Ig-like domain-containing protein, partial [Anaeromyxobacter sp.]